MEKTEAPKTLFKSKTLIVNAVIALASFYPPVGEWVTSNPETSLQILAGLNLILRLITKGRITLFGK